MLNDHHLYLINAGLDGELEAGERAELEQLLAASEDARKLQAELRRMAGLLERVPEQEPPAGLTEQIMQGVRLPGPRRGWSLSGLFRPFQPAPVGLAFAAGLLMTVAYYEVSAPAGEGRDLSRMMGTMVTQLAESPVPGGDLLDVSAPGLAGTASLGEVSDFLVLRLDVTSNQPAEFRLGLAEAGLGFGGIARAADDSYAVNETYEVSGGTLRVVSSGNHPIVVFLRRTEPGRVGPQALALEVSQSGSKVFEGSLRLGSG